MSYLLIRRRPVLRKKIELRERHIDAPHKPDEEKQIGWNTLAITEVTIKKIW